MTSCKERGLVLTALTQNQNASANDAPALAAILAAGQSPRTIAEVEEAIGSRGRTSRSGPRSRRRRTTPCSTPQTVKSLAKGVPNTIPLATLDKVTKANFTGLIAKAKTLEAATMKRLPAEVRELQEGYWLQHLSGDMDVHSCHTNGAGWLPVSSTQPRYT